MRRGSASVNFIISLIIVVGFCLTGWYSYISFQKLFMKDVEAVSELTSENIFVNINNLMDRPMNVSIAMANDTFLRDFMYSEMHKGLNPEELSKIKAYLTAYQQKYKFDSVFFVSAKSGVYYHYKNGIDRIMTLDNPENKWYYDFLRYPADCSLNVDNDEAREDIITIFVNCKLFDDKKNILGIVGVGMETPYIQRFLQENEEKYAVKAYLIDADGYIQVSSNLTESAGVNLFASKMYKDMSAAIVSNTTSTEQKWYHSDEADGYIISKYVPNLNWYLVVEKSTTDFKRQMLRQLGVGFVFMLIVLIVVVATVTRIIGKYKDALTQLSLIDPLTKTKNRASYESEVFKHRSLLATYQWFGIGIFDLNNLKFINDVYGHQVGDAYIKKFAELLEQAFKDCQIFRIGGDEFAIIFLNIDEARIQAYWQELLRISKQIDGSKKEIRSAFGYAFYDADNLNSVDKIFKAADDNMYLDKMRLKKLSEQDGH